MSVDQRKVIASRLTRTTNGSFRLVCVPVAERDTWESTLGLIESKPGLRDMLKAVTVMRSHAWGTSPGETFDSSKPCKEQKEETQGFEGLGEIILQMLARYKIDNVVIAVLFQEFSILKAVSHGSMESVCSRLKEFLLELYSSLVEHNIIKIKTDDITTYRHFDLPLPPEKPQEKKMRLKREQNFTFQVPIIQKVVPSQ
jgi:hypothetical protein